LPASYGCTDCCCRQTAEAATATAAERLSSYESFDDPDFFNRSSKKDSSSRQVIATSDCPML
jgi:hypothetical protein